MTEYPNITPRETTGEDAASAASYVLNNADKIMLKAEEIYHKAHYLQELINDFTSDLYDFKKNAKTAAASALTQVEPKP